MNEPDNDVAIYVNLCWWRNATDVLDTVEPCYVCLCACNNSRTVERILMNFKFQNARRTSFKVPFNVARF
jgi:tRNA(Arg) A34 adenosine deaminase TadA